MKKLCIVLAIVAIGMLQQSTAQEVTFGAKAGINIANFSGGDADRNALIGLQAGLISEIAFSDKFSLQPELLYTRQGSESEDIVKVKLDYIAVPVLAKFYVAENFSVEVGPQFSFLVDDKGDYNDSSIPDADTDASSFDFSANLGLGYNFGSNMFAQLRYNYGITTVVENPDIKNSVFQLALGYKF